MKILVTDGEYKHSISLVKNIKKAYPSANVLVHINDKFGKYFLPSDKICKSVTGDLHALLSKGDFDVVIPVSGRSVKTVSALELGQCLVPPTSLLDRALDKENLGDLVQGYDIKYPVTSKLNFQRSSDFLFPCIVKSSNETQAKIETIYVDDALAMKSLEKDLARYLASDIPLIMQQRVHGIPRGYFGIFKDGTCICEFMHERVREIPHTGGSSTSARSYCDHLLIEKCRNFLEGLRWSGPVMMEFIFDPLREVYYLIEINPKFWGSIDLAHHAGVDFGAALVSAVLDDGRYVKQSWRETQVMWPLDGDLVSIFRSRKFLSILDYFRPNAHVILGENIIAVILKILWSLKKIATRK